MRRFERSDEGTAFYGTAPPKMRSERLQAFHKALWDALVPASGESTSVQGELIRAVERLHSDSLCEGMGNYYEGMGDRGDSAKVEDTYLGQLMVFMLDTLIENRNQGLDTEDVAYFADARTRMSSDWLRQKRIYELDNKYNESEASEAETKELQQLEAAAAATDGRPDWEDVFHRADRCIANWCITNPDFVDRKGRPVEVRGLRHVMAIFEPPLAPPPPCPICNGKGWLPPRDATQFPEVCSCKREHAQPT